ncbi:hypothetical protein [Floridanema evergladense]|uniref:Antitoxin n=1 Tax=Floridaenema evergladense BLCC-F167 TaxID=3153639 RepID=A0ABV4WTZ8_9CYAN
MTQITLAELPETVQNLINQAQKTGEPLTIIQNGIPFAIISPIQKYNNPPSDTTRRAILRRNSYRIRTAWNPNWR